LFFILWLNYSHKEHEIFDLESKINPSVLYEYLITRGKAILKKFTLFYANNYSENLKRREKIAFKALLIQQSGVSSMTFLVIIAS